MPVDPSLLSINQATLEPLGVTELLRLCERAGVRAVGLWRHKLAGLSPSALGRQLARDGVRVSSLCRAGMFPSAGGQEDAVRHRENLRALDEAAALGAEIVVVVSGPPVGRDLRGARARVADGLAGLAEEAHRRDLTLGLEPLHPMMIGERSVIVTLAEALDLVESIGVPWLGVVVDVYHVWWDPQLAAGLERAAGHVVGYHVSDWLVPTTSVLQGRGLMGEGIIDIPAITAGVTGGGYHGCVEVEVMSEHVWSRQPDELLADVKERFARYV